MLRKYETLDDEVQPLRLTSRPIIRRINAELARMHVQVNVKVRRRVPHVPQFWLQRDQLPPAVLACWLTGFEGARFLFEKGLDGEGILKVLSAEGDFQQPGGDGGSGRENRVRPSGLQLVNK
jgi:hypothetical protein